MSRERQGEKDKERERGGKFPLLDFFFCEFNTCDSILLLFICNVDIRCIISFFLMIYRDVCCNVLRNHDDGECQ